ncbi:MAG: hypothetical protein IJE08_10650 [Clostridia bacterium]|nr:hypothetical protein [Clostridia bacterium]
MSVWVFLAIAGVVLYAFKAYELLHPRKSSSGQCTDYTNTCPHCGSVNTCFAESAPKSWQCSECACSYTPSGVIYASSQNQYDKIDAWNDLEQFAEKVLKATENAGFITLENGNAWVCRPGQPRAWLASYPCEGINRDGELHLMLLCMRRCQKEFSRKGIDKYVSIWLTERGLAWEYKA